MIEHYDNLSFYYTDLTKLWHFLCVRTEHKNPFCIMKIDINIWWNWYYLIQSRIYLRLWKLYYACEGIILYVSLRQKTKKLLNMEKRIIKTKVSNETNTETLQLKYNSVSKHYALYNITQHSNEQLWKLSTRFFFCNMLITWCCWKCIRSIQFNQWVWLIFFIHEIA